MPEGTKRVTKGSQNRHKIDIKEKVAKRCEKYVKKVHQDQHSWCHFGVHFHEKSMETNLGKINAETIAKNDETSMRKRNEQIRCFERWVYEKTSFSKEMNVCKPYVLPNRMRVAEGSSKKENLQNEK